MSTTINTLRQYDAESSTVPFDPGWLPFDHLGFVLSGSHSHHHLNTTNTNTVCLRGGISTVLTYHSAVQQAAATATRLLPE
jgi:hypothetical protein